MLDLAMDIPTPLDSTTLARDLLMLSPRLRLMLILLFFMDPIMADMAWVMLDMLDLAMDIPTLLDTITLARGLLMLSPRPRLMLILLFSMVPMDMADMALVIADMAMLPLTLTAMLATHMPGENKLLTR